MKKQYAFYFDSSACSGCKACQIACKDKNNLDDGVLWRRVYEIAGGDWLRDGDAYKPQLTAYNLSISCNHCQDPPCMHACPTKAIRKRDDGIVYILSHLCMGCKYCEWVCPYGAPQYNEKEGIMEKCDFCMDYIDEGKKPVCVSACPMRVLDYGEFEELKSKHGLDHVYPLPPFHLTQPAFLLTKHKDADKLPSSKLAIVNKEEVNYVG